MKQNTKFSFLQIILLVLGFFGFIIIIWWLRNYLGNERIIIIALIAAILTFFMAGRIIRTRKEKRLKELLKEKTD